MPTRPTANAAPLPLACVPGAIPAAERDAHFALIGRLFREALREQRDVPGGRAYRFDPVDLASLAKFIDNERRCCPFLTFTLEQSPDDGPIWLHLTGPEGTREFLDAELAPVTR